MANAEIISIGSELLLGQIMDTNASWMAQRLTDLGVNLFYKTVVGDNPDRMAEVIERALERSDIVITGGGLGPTQDDITREIVAQVTNRKLIKEPELVLQLQERFQKRGMIMTPNNERQAFIPEGSIIVNNPNGTAPSFIVDRNIHAARSPLRDEMAVRQRGCAIPPAKIQPRRDDHLPSPKGGRTRREPCR